MTVPDGAQLSEDGKYWWDGADWQPVPEDSGAEVGQVSDDGQWKWDGSQWQPVDSDNNNENSDDNSNEGGDLSGALAEAGIEIDAGSADAGYIQQMYDHLSNWYADLDEKGQAIIDSLSKNGADNILADPEVGVVSEGDPLISAFANNQMTLGESLEATGQALQSQS